MTSAHSGSTTAIEDLRALNARFIHNFVTNDVPSHDAILHPDFTAIQSSGATLDRKTYLKGWATGYDPVVVLYWDTRDEVITVIGDVALVRSTNKHTIRRDGRDTTGMTRYTDTYVRADGAWLCIQAQSTPVLPEHWPSDSTIVSVYVDGKRRDGQNHTAERG